MSEMSDSIKDRHDLDWIEGIDPRLEVMSPVPLVLQPRSSFSPNSESPTRSTCSSAISRIWTMLSPSKPVPLEGWEIELSGLISPIESSSAPRICSRWNRSNTR